ncbi:MAG: RNA-binding S4 domain-containing protein [Candidatus Eisenbacteria bacterium]|uniref:RNA-binding S4 domain-containing protein n=1 Tax=Eiseniibacteriota bacterium TaxID=2212470 RepID=A0A948S0T1_UNCEI|nr:RNA-binding S4 domain-containing protein [Candidatus Eisenbacteria bacterium]MBU1948312.1 RNA-binding S4 domain-containing protein [Candidatus Eisenbacteria bacterium]MBU2693104.1 RNA-binding S4 domain-containing protein [Candidatus Eisenbacteria bacterium]
MNQQIPQEEHRIRLDQFLKLQGITSTGGMAKQRIQSGEVLVNGEVEIRRGRRLRPGDRVTVEGEIYLVEEDLW